MLFISPSYISSSYGFVFQRCVVCLCHSLKSLEQKFCLFDVLKIPRNFGGVVFLSVERLFKMVFGGKCLLPHPLAGPGPHPYLPAVLFPSAPCLPSIPWASMILSLQASLRSHMPVPFLRFASSLALCCFEKGEAVFYNFLLITNE